MNLIHPGTTRTAPVFADDGPYAGLPVGAARDHWDGRRDAIARRGVTTLVPRRMYVDTDDLIRQPQPRIWAPPVTVRGLDPAARMAVTVSGLFFPTYRDMWDNSDLVIDYINDTVNLALFTNTITPSFSADTAYGVSPYNANQVPNGSGYTTGGVALGTKTVTESPTGTIMIDAADSAWTTATFSSVRCGLVWDDTVTIVADAALCLINFGADYAVTSGTFTVQYAATGIWTIDLTP